ncbi:MAG: T9SS type A sorting domain-containing protein [bacterium]|nr:T9SS type A sorting domain-containing protein [bacterium]
MKKVICLLSFLFLFVAETRAQVFQISVADSSQIYPDVAFDGTNFWTVWADNRNGTSRIYGARIATDGTVLDTNGILLASLPDTDYTMPSVAFGDSVFCVAFHISGGYDTTPVYCSFKDVGAVRFQRGGNIIDTIPNFIYGWSGMGYYVRYSDMPIVMFGKKHFFFSLSMNTGSSMEGFWDSEIQSLGDTCMAGAIGLPGFHSWAPTGVWNGEKFFIVWTQNPCDTFVFGIGGAFIDDSLIGQSVDSSQFKVRSDKEVPMDMLLGGCSERSKELAFGSNHYLLVSETELHYKNKIWYDILSDSGKPINSLPTIIDTGNSVDQRLPTCAYNNGKFIAVWQNSISGDTNLYGIIIDTLGGIIDSGHIDKSPFCQKQPSLATGAGKTLLVWSDNRNGNFDIYGMFIGDTLGVKENSDLGFLNVGLKIKKNPFVQSTMISYQLPVGGKVSLAVYDVSGRCVKTLVNGIKEAGQYKAEINAENLKAGIYFVSVKTGDYKETKKLIILK